MVNMKNYRPKNANFILNILGTFLDHNFSTPATLFINGKPEKLSTQKNYFYIKYFGNFFGSQFINPMPQFLSMVNEKNYRSKNENFN
jgi:hypothetical protein